MHKEIKTSDMESKYMISVLFIYFIIFKFKFRVLFWQFLCYSQNGDDPQEDLAKFGYTLINMKVKILKHPSILSATYLNHV